LRLDNAIAGRTIFTRPDGGTIGPLHRAGTGCINACLGYIGESTERPPRRITTGKTDTD
jgi:hypothetical protein